MTKNVNQLHANVEQRRHNLATEALTEAQNREAHRANLAKEAENERNNRATANNAMFYNKSADYHWARQDAETARNNRAVELLTDQKNTNDFVTKNQANSNTLVTTRENNRAAQKRTDTQSWVGLLGTLGSALIRGIGSKGSK